MNLKERILHDIGLAFLMAMVILILVLTFAGCKCPEYVAGTETEKEVIVNVHDTTIITEPDSASIAALLHCDSAYNVVVEELSTLNGKRLQMALNAQKQGNGDVVLHVDCKEDSLMQVIHWQDSIIKSHTTQNIIKEVVPPFYKGSTIALWVLIACTILGAILVLIIKFK